LWKYENRELKNEFHKVFYNEKSNYFTVDFLTGLIFSVADRIPFVPKILSKIAPEYYNEKFIENKITNDYFAYGLKEKIKKKKKKEKCKEDKGGNKSIPIVIIENMDRLTIEEKITALSSIYNYRESFNSHIIIALDPESVRKTTNHFESLIHKCFTAYMYISPKTKYILQEYIYDKIPKNRGSTSNKYNELVNMLITQYPISLREINHCINTYVMSFTGQGDCDLKLFMAILQVQYHQLYRAISQNPYILKKFIHHANDSAFDGYKDYNINNKQIYKLNLLIKSLGNIDFQNKNILMVLSPLNRKFLREKEYSLEESIIFIELLRKAQLEKDVILKIENILKKNSFTINELDKFLTEVIKDRITFINFFESQNFDEIYNILIVFNNSSESLFLETILSYNVEKINDYSFYDNYSKVMKIFTIALKHNKYGHLLIHRILENFQLARKLIEDTIDEKNRVESGLEVEDNNYFVVKLKRLSFIKKILYTTHFFEAMDSTTILTLKDIIAHSIRDLDIKKFESIEKFKQESIENFYLEIIPTDRYEFVTVELILDITRSELFKRIDNSRKVKFYEKVFENSELLNYDEFYLVIQNFSSLLNESFSIADIDIILDVLQKIKILYGNLSDIHPLVLKKFIQDTFEEFGKYDVGLKNKLLSIKI